MSALKKLYRIGRGHYIKICFIDDVIDRIDVGSYPGYDVFYSLGYIIKSKSKLCFGSSRHTDFSLHLESIEFMNEAAKIFDKNQSFNVLKEEELYIETDNIHHFLSI